MLRIYVANLGKYNEGELVGKWLTLPCTDEELEQLYIDVKVAHRDEDDDFVPYYEENGIIYEETAIHDYETDFDSLHVSEYANIEELNELAERLEEYDKWEREEIEACIEAEGCELEEAMDACDNGELILYSNVNNLADLAAYLVDEGAFSTETLLRYIDYDALGRDLRFDGYTEVKNGVLYYG